MKKNLSLIFISIFLTLFLIYILIFLKISFENNQKSEYLFKSHKSLNFHKKYSNILNHLRNSNQDWDIDGNEKNFLYSIINNFDKTNKEILLQGDSWIEQINLEKESLKNIINYSKKYNHRIINGGITSFSPTLMMLQFEILKKDFNIQPDIVVAYIDQTDIGDEICRYKNKRYFNSENKLIGVKSEKFSRSIYDYSRIYRLSEIHLDTKNNFVNNLLNANFFIEFKIKRAIVKINNILSSGFKNMDEKRCYFGEIQKYLKEEIKKSDKQYFQDRLKDYLNLILNDTKIEKIFIVTFPHRNNFFDIENKDFYRVNVADLVDEELNKLNNPKINHINFYKLLKDNPKFNFEIYREGDPASHLNEAPHNEIFINEILKNITESN